MNRALAFCACLAVAAPACVLPAFAQPASPKSDVASVPGRDTASFVQQAALSDLYEIQTSELALNKAGDEPTKAFARQMIKDHTKTTNEIKTMVQGGKVDAKPAASLDNTHQRMFDRLQAMDSQQFTIEYRREQVKAHNDAVAMFTQYAKDGDNQVLKAWAARTLPTLKHHLEMAQSLAK